MGAVALSFRPLWIRQINEIILPAIRGVDEKQPVTVDADFTGIAHFTGLVKSLFPVKCKLVVLWERQPVQLCQIATSILLIPSTRAQVAPGARFHAVSLHKLHERPMLWIGCGVIEPRDPRVADCPVFRVVGAYVMADQEITELWL